MAKDIHESGTSQSLTVDADSPSSQRLLDELMPGERDEPRRGGGQ